MIGNASFYLELVFAAFPLIFVIASIVLIFKKTPKAVFMLVPALVMLALIDVRFYYQLKNRQTLKSLSAQKIESIKVGNKKITSPEEMALVVAELNKTEWFSSNHGGWAREIPLLIKHKSGEENEFSVALYRREEGGAIIRFQRNGFFGSRASDGYAYSANLPETLKKIQFALPENE